MSDCQNCNWEHLCAYKYKPCDCVHKRKFREKSGIVVCPNCNGQDCFPKCKACNGSGAVILEESNRG